MSGNLNEVLNKLREELSSLASFIDKTRQGIDNLETTVKIGSERFPEASNQLSAVTGELENAANKIMTILEGLMSVRMAESVEQRATPVLTVPVSR